MSGNVWEWVADWYDAQCYATPASQEKNPEHRVAGPGLRVVRGGAWADNAVNLRAAARGGDGPADRDVNIGARSWSARRRVGESLFVGCFPAPCGRRTPGLSCCWKRERTLAFEALQISTMMQHHGLAKSIVDVAWGQFVRAVITQCYGFGNGRFGHPDQDRAITLREAALLQTFPEAYQFVAPEQPLFFSAVGRLIGNAVPVMLGRVIGQSIVDHFTTAACP